MSKQHFVWDASRWAVVVRGTNGDEALAFGTYFRTMASEVPLTFKTKRMAQEFIKRERAKLGAWYPPGWNAGDHWSPIRCVMTWKAA